MGVWFSDIPSRQRSSATSTDTSAACISVFLPSCVPLCSQSHSFWTRLCYAEPHLTIMSNVSCPMCWRDAHSTPPSTTLVFLCFQPVESNSVFVEIIKSAFGYFRLLLQCYLVQLLCFDTRAATSKGRYRISPANIWNRLQSVFLKICYTCVFCTFPTGSTVSYPLEEKQYTPVIVLDLLVR